MDPGASSVIGQERTTRHIGLIGLIGGIGPAATDFYYRSLIRGMASAGVDLELTLVHADAPTLLANQQGGETRAQVEIYQRLAHRLRAAGAGCVAVTSIAGHFCIDAFAQVSVLPVIDLRAAVSAAVSARGYTRVGLLGTRGVMASHFYGALGDVEVVLPQAAALDEVHDAYVMVAMTAMCTEEQRLGFFEAGRALVEQQGADAVLLAGTDLALAFDGYRPGFPVLDCALAHVQEILIQAQQP